MAVGLNGVERPRFLYSFIPFCMTFFAPFATVSWFVFRSLGSEHRKSVGFVWWSRFFLSALLFAFPCFCLERAIFASRGLDFTPTESYLHVLIWFATFLNCLLATAGGFLVSYGERRKFIPICVIGFLTALLSIFPIYNVASLRTNFLSNAKTQEMITNMELQKIGTNVANLGEIRPILIARYEAFGSNVPAYLLSLPEYQAYTAEAQTCFAVIPPGAKPGTFAVNPNDKDGAYKACAKVFEAETLYGLRFGIDPVGMLRDLLPTKVVELHGLASEEVPAGS